MENKRFIIFIYILIFMGLSCLSPVFVYGYSEKTTHPALTQEVVKFFNQNYPDLRIDDNGAELVIRGSIDEDLPGRWMRHFYDPINNKGVWYGKWWQSSKDWAKDAVAQATYKPQDFYKGALYGATKEYFSGNTDHSWERAVYEYAWGDRDRALYSLGHILHLIEDATVPEHSRNDPHPAFGKRLQDEFPKLNLNAISNLLEGIDQTDESPYEIYTAKFDRSSIDVRVVGAPLILNNLDNFFDNTANYSNNNFFSRDSIENYKNPKISFFGEEKLNDGRFYKFAYFRNLENDDYKLAYVEEEGGLLRTRDIKYLLDDPDNLIMSDYWERLSKKAVINGAGAIKLFFDEVEKEKQTKELYKKNRNWFQRVFDNTKQKIFGVADSLYGVSVPYEELNNEASVAQVVPDIDVDEVPGSPTATSGRTARIGEDNGRTAETDEEQFSLEEAEVILAQVEEDLNDMQEEIEEISGRTAGNEVVGKEADSDNKGNDKEYDNGYGKGNITGNNKGENEDNNKPKVKRGCSGCGGGGGPKPPAEPEQEQNNEEPEPEPEPEPQDIQPPQIIFNIDECANSLANNEEGCLLSGQDINFSWSTSSNDVATYTLSCASETGDCSAFPKIFDNTVATSSAALSDNSAYTFTLTAEDENENQSASEKTVEIASAPVVINEVAWMGTNASSYDEWLELYNPTSQDISLENWVLYSETDGAPYLKFSKAENKIIPAQGFYLIERKNVADADAGETASSSVKDIPADFWVSFGRGLKNSCEKLKLIRVSQTATTTVDATPNCSNWAGGEGNPGWAYKSMERYDPLSSGADPLNWGTNNTSIKNGLNTEEGPIYGTPKAKNSISYQIVGPKSGHLTVDKTLTKAESPYFMPNTLIIDEGATLTIEPGVVIKAMGNTHLNVRGTLKSLGEKDNEVIFTSFYDNQYAPELTGNPAIVGPGNWGTIIIHPESQNSEIKYTRVRYGGKYYNTPGYEQANLAVIDTSAQISNSAFEYSMAYGLRLRNSNSTVSNSVFQYNDGNMPGCSGACGRASGIYIEAGAPTITGNTIKENKFGLRAGAAPGIEVSNNTFQNNEREAMMSTPGGQYSGNTAFGNYLNGIVLVGPIPANATTTLSADTIPYLSMPNIPANSALTFQEGTVIKLSSAQPQVYGNLFYQGATSTEVIFTSLNDDSILGDTNNNGTSTLPMPGNWDGIKIYPGAHFNMSGFTLKYGGCYIGCSGDERGGLLFDSANGIINNALIDSNYKYGIRAVNDMSLTIKNTTIQNHTLPDTLEEKAGLKAIGATINLENVNFLNNSLGIKSASSVFNATSTTFDGNGAKTDPPDLF